MRWKTVSLNGAWQFRKVGERTWYPAVVPGCVHTDLMRNHVIADAAWGMRELEQFWVAEADWEYRRRFRTPADFRRGVRLVFEGLDTDADVRLNGKRLARTCNMHRRYAFDVTERLRADADNDLLIRFRSPVRAARRLRKMAPRIDCFQHDRRWPFVERAPTCRNFIRKAQYQFDWDWGMCQPTSGVWRDVRLETGGVYADYLTTRQHHRRGAVDLEVTLFFGARRAGKGALAVRIAGFQALKPLRWRPGENRVSVTVRVNNPKIWWPNGLGKQPLYDLEATLLDAAGGELRAVKKRVGFRTVELVRKPDAIGESFGFAVNGVPVFAKGANWVPASTLPSSVTPDTYRFLLGSCVAANFNCLRVWGGGIYESDLFYDLCDELGIMVWQDHMMACTCYPAVKRFSDELAGEIVHNVRRLQSHASIVLWCGDNEGEAAMQAWFRNQPNIDYLRREYYRLMEGPVRKVTRREDPSRPFWLSSPSSGPGHRKEPYSHDRGDTHFWDVWFTEAAFSRYLEVRPRFVSEFGFQSFPHASTLARSMRSADLNVSSPVMEHHQRTPGGNARVLEMAARYFRMPKDFASFCCLSQLTGLLALKTAVEHWRRTKPRCQGALYWQLNDTWPTISCATIDSELEWKAAHYAARRFFAPVLGSFHPTAKGELSPVEVWVTSDLRKPLGGRWKVELCGVDGKRKAVAAKGFMLHGGESRKLATIDPGKVLKRKDPRRHFLRLTVRAGGHVSQNLHTFGPWKFLELPKAKLKVRVKGGVKEGLKVTVSSEVPAFFVELFSTKVPGTFSDNCFHLVDGRARELTFTPRGGARRAALAKFRSGLHVRSLAETC